MGKKVNREMLPMPFFTVHFHENDSYADQIVEADFVRPFEQVVTFVKRGEVIAEVPRSLVLSINRFSSRMEAELYMVDHPKDSRLPEQQKDAIDITGREHKSKSTRPLVEFIEVDFDNAKPGNLHQPRRKSHPSAARVQELGVRRPQSLMGKAIAGGLVESVKVALPESSDPSDDDREKKPEKSEKESEVKP